MYALEKLLLQKQNKQTSKEHIMNILILNGSPRPTGNTKTGLTTIMQGIEKNMPTAQVELIDAYKLKVTACIHCEQCKANGGTCVLPDDSSAIIQKVTNADLIIFGSPVYWWGISAQLKLVLDKFYSNEVAFKKKPKSIGILAVGGAEQSDPEYRIIREQFKCIAGYLGWKLAFSESVTAHAKDDLIKDKQTLSRLEAVWQKIA